MNFAFKPPGRVLLCLSLCACATPYTPPQGDQVAVITFTNQSRHEGQAILFDDPVDCSGGRNTETIAPGTSLRTKIPAGQPLSFAQYYAWVGTSYPYSTYYNCKSIATFTPELGKEYEANLSGNNTACLLQLFEIKESGRQPTSFVLRDKIKNYWDQSSPQCTTAVREAELIPGVTNTPATEAEAPRATSPAGAAEETSVTGTWQFKIREQSFRIFDRPFPILELKQDGDRVTGVSPDGGYRIDGKRAGDRIEFYFIAPRQEGRGWWRVSASGNRMEGAWTVQGSGVEGTWKMQRRVQIEE